MCRNTILRCQILHHGVGATMAQIVVVSSRTDRVRSARNFKDVALRASKLRCEAVQLILVVLGQYSLVKAEMSP